MRAVGETEAPVRAPEIGGAVAWINVDQPLSLKALRGKVVLLDFWTYGCVNCMHVLPDLKRLERKYANELVVIGVHSPKFDNEKDVANLRKIVQRYDIKHPVAQDSDFRIWRAYTVRAWPTLVLIDPAGYLVGGASGEGHGEQFDQAIAAVIHVFEERGELDRVCGGGGGGAPGRADVSGQGAGRFSGRRKRSAVHCGLESQSDSRRFARWRRAGCRGQR